MGRKVCIICNRYECGGYGHGHIPDHEPDYMDEDDFHMEEIPPLCWICEKPIKPKFSEDPDLEFYVIAGTYFEDMWSIAKYDLEPQYLICIECFNEKLASILKLKKQVESQLSDLEEMLNQLIYDIISWHEDPMKQEEIANEHIEKIKDLFKNLKNR